MLKILNAGSMATIVRYGLVAVCAFLFAGGKIDASQFEAGIGSLDKIAAVVGVLAPILLGVKATLTPKAVVEGGRTVAIKNLPAAAQDAIEHAAAATPKANFLEQLLGMFWRK